MSDKQPMQASGAGTPRDGPESDREPNDQDGASQGGAYPNPHTGKKGGHFDGGQTGQGYHGTGQLGAQKTGEQPNAGSTAE
ncbi:hypothetical protein [Sphingomonas radiodurans]|uniref:hypothetical protein n=1 Tax=Sphingomonas radiodurans TaxID=2890321 RepID=UPI001E2F7887|nr:hypothetical protein [Sphingomonas radiodurans]WBH15341.1 hypothetical protein LLW23_10845 [Sphingomonas radiodurans]